MRKGADLFPVIWMVLVLASRAMPGVEAKPAPLGPALELVRDERAQAAIVTAAKPSANARVAAAELQEYLEKITSAKLPIATDENRRPARSPRRPKQAHRGHRWFEDPRRQDQKPPGRGICFVYQWDRLVLAGNDVEPYYGTRYAVADFLHRLGVRWFMPGEIGRVVPKMATVSIGPLCVIERPDFPVRNFWEHARDRMGAECAEWKIHNKMNPRATDAAFGVPGDSSVQGYLPKDQFPSSRPTVSSPRSTDCPGLPQLTRTSPTQKPRSVTAGLDGRLLAAFHTACDRNEKNLLGAFKARVP